MYFTEYRADMLPQITLIGKDEQATPHKNINRVSEDYVFYLITNGELFFREDGKDYHLKKGDCFLFEPNKHHFGTTLSQYHLIYIHFRHDQIRHFQIAESDWIERAKERNKRWLTSADIFCAPDRTILIPKLVSFTDRLAFSSVCELASKAVARSKNRLENYNVLCAGTVNELFIELYRQFVSMYFAQSDHGVAGFSLINKVIDYLNANYSEKISSERIATALSYNFDYLNQLFKKNLETSIFQVLESIRIEAAKSMIKTTSLTLEQIAENVGYENESYFSKVFKKHTGIPPSQYRQQT